MGLVGLVGLGAQPVYGVSAYKRAAEKSFGRLTKPDDELTQMFFDRKFGITFE